MSTKSSIASGKTWHLYVEMRDDTIRLEMNDAVDSKIVVSERWHAVVVTLPTDVLDTIAEQWPRLKKARDA